MGGNGYIEDFVMPKLLRDVNVLPIWEGSGNIIVLDMLRASKKSDGLNMIIEQIKEAAQKEGKSGSFINKKLGGLLSTWDKTKKSENQDVVEATAKPLFKELIHLYQMALMMQEKDDTSKAWINPALEYMVSIFKNDIDVEKPVSLQTIEALIGWEY